MFVLLVLALVSMPQDQNKKQLWDSFLKSNKVVEESVPLLAAEDGVVKTIEYGKNKRLVLAGAPEMEKRMRSLGKSLSDQHKSGNIKSSGILYMMFRKEEKSVVPLYIGKAEIFGKGDKNLSVNISDLLSGSGKFGRWGYGYAYHLGDLSAVTLPGHPESKKTRKYTDWRDALFESKDGNQHLKGDIRFWCCEWSQEQKSIWREYGSTRLTFEEYLLIGVASDLFPKHLLNREGRNR